MNICFLKPGGSSGSPKFKVGDKVKYRQDMNGPIGVVIIVFPEGNGKIGVRFSDHSRVGGYDEFLRV